MEPLGSLTDEELALRIQHGESEPLGVLMGRYEPKLLRYGTKFLSGTEDIVDLVQEVFVSVYQNIQSYDASRRFSPWIYRIAHNAFVGELRKRSRQPVRFFGFEFDTFVPHPVQEATQVPEVEAKEMRSMVEEGLSKISPAYSEILILRYLEELSYQEIADVLRIPLGTVSVRIARGRTALRATYGDQSPL
ncbi:MAG: sigW [Parcubacteria group bacterium]|nr:sigW [Parcubacteria group bacterium]